jgi:hypothetical protein
MANQKQNKLPKPTRISRKLALSSERLVVMTGEVAKPEAACTNRKTGCPIHTC